MSHSVSLESTDSSDFDFAGNLRKVRSMSDTATAPEVTNAAPPAPKAGSTRKLAKAGKKASTKGKKATKKAAKKTSKPRAKKEGLRKGQVKVLEVLSKNSQPLDRKEISKKGKIDLASLTGYIGSDDLKTREYNDKTYFKTLLTYGYVKAQPGDPRKGKDGTFSESPGPTVYTITAAGRKAISK